MDLRTKNLILELKEQIRKTNAEIAYYVSVKQRMKEESRYVNDESCSIMMSAMDRKLLQEVHVPICLNKTLSSTVIKNVTMQCDAEIAPLKAKADKLQKEVNTLEKINKE